MKTEGTPLETFNANAKKIEKQITKLAAEDGEREVAEGQAQRIRRAIDRLYDVARFVDADAAREDCWTEIRRLAAAKMLAIESAYTLRTAVRTREIVRLTLENARAAYSRPY